LSTRAAAEKQKCARVLIGLFYGTTELVSIGETLGTRGVLEVTHLDWKHDFPHGLGRNPSPLRVTTSIVKFSPAPHWPRALAGAILMDETNDPTCAARTASGTRRAERGQESTRHPSVLPELPYDASNWKGVVQALLNHHNGQRAKRERPVSGQTMQDRANFYFLFFRTLREQGRFLDPRDLKEKHVRLMVQHWLAEDLAPATLQKYLSHLRTFAGWIRKGGLVRAPETYVPDGLLVRRTYTAQTDKGWNSNGVDVDTVIAQIQAFDPHVGAQLLAMRAFGLRPKEVTMLRPHESVLVAAAVPDTARTASGPGTATLYLFIEHGAKGGRHRYIPIDTPEKVQAVELLLAAAPSRNAHLGDPGRSLKANRRRFRYVLERFGLTKRGSGVTAYGLRHAFAHETYRAVAGDAAPIQQGAAVSRTGDATARSEVARQLGHSRARIAGAYLGKSARAAKRTPPEDQEGL